MGLLLKNSHARKRDQVLAIDLGGRTTKAVQVQRRGDKYTLLNFAVLDTPDQGKALSVSSATELFKEISRLLGARAKQVTLALGVEATIFRQVEMPLMPVPDMRQMLKYNAKNYLQQDLPDHVFDCSYSLAARGAKTTEGGKPAPGAPKQKVMVGAAKRKTIEEFNTAMKTAGFLPDQIVPGLIGPANAFEVAEPDIYAKELVALVDLGFTNTSITILDGGEILLNRVVAIGGDQLTQALAETLGTSYQEAESIKVGMPGEVQQNLEQVVHPLGRELRASIDFFEHQQDKTVGRIFLSGGAVRNELIVQILQNELMVPCELWMPTKTMQLTLPPERAGEIEAVSSQLTVALGAAISAF